MIKWANNIIIYRTPNYIYHFGYWEDVLLYIPKEKIINDLAINLSGMDVRGYFLHQPHFFEDLDHLQIVIDLHSSEVVGIFSSKWYKVWNKDILLLKNFWLSLKLNGGIVASEMLGFHFINLLKMDSKYPYIMFTKTYNPAAYKLFGSFKVNNQVDFYPIISANNGANKLSQLADQLAKIVTPQAKLIPEKGILKDGHASLGTSFFSEQPKSSTEIINKFFSENLTINDQVLCIVDFNNYNNMLECFMKFGKTYKTLLDNKVGIPE